MQLTIYSRKLDPSNPTAVKAFQKRVAARVQAFDAAQKAATPINSPLIELLNADAARIGAAFLKEMHDAITEA